MAQFGGLRTTHGIVGTIAPWFAEPAGAPKETAEAIDAIVAVAGGQTSRGRTTPNAEMGNTRDAREDEDENAVGAYARERLAEHARAKPATTSAGTSSAAAPGGCGEPDREEL